MQERLKELPKRFLEYWNKWNSKQKTIIISSISAVIIMVAILVAVLGRTVYVDLYTFETTKTASEVVSLLREQEITTKLGADNVTVKVDEKSYADAMMAVSTSDITDSGFSWEDMLNTSLTTTNGERLLMTHLRQESDIKTMMKKYYQGVVDVSINYIPKDTSNSILTTSKSTPISVMLVTDSSFDKDSAEAIAKWVSLAVGNEDTESIKIVDQKGTVLYDGPQSEEEKELDITDKMAMSTHLKEEYVEAVTGAMLMNHFTEVNVAIYLDINYDKVTQLYTEQLPLEGSDRGVLTEWHENSSEGTNGTGNIPGTDSNDEVDYYVEDGTSGEYASSSQDSYYEPSVRVTETLYDTGTINAEKSSISVTATRVIQRTEEELEILGLLDDMSFEEYKLRNSDPIRTETSEELVSIVSMATGIPIESVTLLTYDIYQFIPREEVAKDWTAYIQILLAVILLAFLLFVVFRGTAPVEVTELEAELSIEQLIATTKENQSLEDVEFSEQSETRKMIEKFFDENPDAVAQLLRNWLNEDWD